MDTRIKKGQHLSKATEFKPGKHWRPHQPWWERHWLVNEYVAKKRSAAEIAVDWGVTENAIYFWIKKHKIPTRTVSEVRAIKYWGSLGEKNPQFGKRGVLNPNWKGGLTPARQAIYAKSEMRQAMRDVYRRDRVCRLCDAKQELEIHHIDPFSQSPLLVMDIGNMIVLCKKCHRKIRGKERAWKRRLFSLINKKGG